MYELHCVTDFAAAHNLRGYKGLCENLHGHNWTVEIFIASRELDSLGMVMDFKEVKALLSTILERLDHKYLNELEPFDTINPTTENLARVIATDMEAALPEHIWVRRVEVWESPRCSAAYMPERITKLE